MNLTGKGGHKVAGEGCLMPSTATVNWL